MSQDVRPPVIAYHVVVGAYGHWLPNDPRGSGSTDVRAPNLRPFGEAIYVDSARSVAARPHDRRRRLAAKEALTHPPVVFTGPQARAIGRGFGVFVKKAGLTVWACAILPTHFHLVVARHRYRIEQVVNLLKGAATRRLLAEKLHPFDGLELPGGGTPHCFGRRLRFVFLHTPEEVADRVAYVEANPVREGLPRQQWTFVTPLNAGSLV